MADNKALPASGGNAATHEVSHSGETDAHVQIMQPAHVTGSEGSKTIQGTTQSTGSAVPAAAHAIGGTDGTNLRMVKTDSSGELQIDVLTLPASTNTLEVVGDVAQDVAVAGNPVLHGGRASSAVPTAMAADGRAVYNWLDRAGAQVVNGRDAHDAALDSNSNPVMVGGRASAAAPSDVSGDGDAVRAWRLRNGAEAVVVTAAGALVGGDATNGLDVDVTRLPALVAGSANIGDVDVLTLPASSTMNATSGDGTTALTNSAQAIKGTAGVLTGYAVYNPNATVAYIVFYNTAQGSVTVGTTTPHFIVPVPPGQLAHIAFSCPITFGTAMSWAATAAAATNGALGSAVDATAWYI